MKPLKTTQIKQIRKGSMSIDAISRGSSTLPVLFRLFGEAKEGPGMKSDEKHIFKVIKLSALVIANTSICNSNTFVIEVAGSIYSWASSTSGFTSTNANPAVSAPVTTTYSLCVNSNLMTITVNLLPNPSVSRNSVPCELYKADTYTSTIHSDNTYSWTISGGTMQSGQGTNSVSINLGSSGTGLLTLIETNPSTTGCSKTVT